MAIPQTEYRCPVLDGQVRGHERRAALVMLRDHLEQELRTGSRERHVAQFVDDLPPPPGRASIHRGSDVDPNNRHTLVNTRERKTVRDIRRATGRKFSAEEKIRIVLEGLRGEETIAELCRKEGIAQNLYHRWSKDFLEAGKKRLACDVARETTPDEVKRLLAEARQLKEALAMRH